MGEESEGGGLETGKSKTGEPGAEELVMNEAGELGVDGLPAIR